MNDRATILAVDDTSASLALLGEILSEAGYRVRPADSGELALAAVAASPPDLILLDVCMEGIDGLEVCRRLKASEETRQIPIILVSAFAEVKDWVEGLRLGAADYITKPFQAAELLARVETQLSLGRAAKSLEHQAASLQQANEQLQLEIADRRRVEDLLRQSLDRTERSRRAMLSTLEDQKQAAESLRAQSARSGAVNLLKQSLLAPAPVEQKLKLITDGVVRLFDADFCRIWVTRPGDRCDPGCFHAAAKDGPHACLSRERCLHLLASSGRYSHTDGNVHARIPMGCYQIGMIASGDEHRLLTNDVQSDPRVHDRAWARELGLVSFAGYQLCAPEGQSLGVLALFAKHPIGPDEDALLDGISSTATFIAQEALAGDARQKLEAQLLQSQKMEGIGNLAGGVAHDFNNLLTVIDGYTGFALEAVREGDPLRGDLLEISKASRHAAGLTRQLLAFSRKQVLEPKLLDLNRVITDLDKMLRRIVGEDLDLRLVLASDLGQVMADPGQLEQVIMNLVVNARDAMPEGGKIAIQTSNAELSEEYAASHAEVKPGAHVLLSVADSGCGMDQQTQDRMFEPFFTTKEQGKGTGLGLSTVYGIVRQSGGSIEVRSELSRGTTFRIYLPRDFTAAMPVSETVTKSAGTNGSETILVVEDEDGLRNLIRRTLVAAGYTVLTAANGPEALGLSELHQADIQLVLTDIVMPQMGGRVLAERLAAARPGIKVLYMSGYTDDAIVHHGVVGAGTHFLGKPFSAVALTRKVRDVLDG
jgi:signal transduction histidine kinase/DNA-binding response OmpR family regulator